MTTSTIQTTLFMADPSLSDQHHGPYRNEGRATEGRDPRSRRARAIHVRGSVLRCKDRLELVSRDDDTDDDRCDQRDDQDDQPVETSLDPDQGRERRPLDGHQRGRVANPPSPTRQRRSLAFGRRDVDQLLIGCTWRAHR